jgi:hypothetical protein
MQRIDPDALQRVSEMVAQWRALPHAELEVRLGQVCGGGRFVSGVEPSTLERIESLLNSNQSFVSSNWEEFHTYNYEQDGEALRTRVSFDPYAIKTVPSTVRKSTVASLLCRCGDLALRVALSTETPVTPKACVVSTEHVRVQQRRTFEWKASARYDLSRVWAGKTRSEAETARGHAAPTHEVEIEWIAPPDAEADDAHVAASLLLKAADFATHAVGITLYAPAAPVAPARRRSKRSR